MKCNYMNSTSYRDEHFRESLLSQEDAHIQSCQINMALQDRQRRRTSTAPASPFPETEEPATENNPRSFAKVLIHSRKYSYRRRSTSFMFGSLSLSNPIVFCAVLLLYTSVILMATPLVSATDLMGKTEGRFAPLLNKKGHGNNSGREHSKGVRKGGQKIRLEKETSKQQSNLDLAEVEDDIFIWYPDAEYALAEDDNSIYEPKISTHFFRKTCGWLRQQSKHIQEEICQTPPHIDGEIRSAGSPQEVCRDTCGKRNDGHPDIQSNLNMHEELSRLRKLQTTAAPSVPPSVTPSISPSPSTEPSPHPSEVPSLMPTSKPSLKPSRQPSMKPSSSPSRLPSSMPSYKPSALPTSTPSLEPSSRPSPIPSLEPSTLPSSRPSSAPSLKPSMSPSRLPSSAPSPEVSTVPSLTPSKEPSVTPSALPSFLPSTRPSTRPSARPSNIPSTGPSLGISSPPSLRPSPIPSSMPSVRPSSRPSSKPTVLPSTIPTSFPSLKPSWIPSVIPSIQPSQIPSKTASLHPSSEPSSTPSSSLSSLPTSRPSSMPSYDPTTVPSSNPSSLPSSQPSLQPSHEPSHAPSTTPTEQPSSVPSPEPSRVPTSFPSAIPSEQPSLLPSIEFSSVPSVLPSTNPSRRPSLMPSLEPSLMPSVLPSKVPSRTPSLMPSLEPSGSPSSFPSMTPSRQPSLTPSFEPSLVPSLLPTAFPSEKPTRQPSSEPSQYPSTQPSGKPSKAPSKFPTSMPSTLPSQSPTSVPSHQPSVSPTRSPSTRPSSQPTQEPSSIPTNKPSQEPSSIPTNQPTLQPSSQPTSIPSLYPSTSPSMHPSDTPSSIPSLYPTSMPSVLPTSSPSLVPSISKIPSLQPTSQPTSLPSLMPTSAPSQMPTSKPTSQPTSSPSSMPSYPLQEMDYFLLFQFDDLSTFTGKATTELEDLVSETVEAALETANNDDFDVSAFLFSQEPFNFIGAQQIRRKLSGTRLLQDSSLPGLEVGVEVYVEIRSAVIYDKNVTRDDIALAFDTEIERQAFFNELQIRDSSFSRINAMEISINNEPVKLRSPDGDGGPNSWIFIGSGIGAGAVGVSAFLLFTIRRRRRRNQQFEEDLEGTPSFISAEFTNPPDPRINLEIEVDEDDQDITTLGDPVYGGPSNMMAAAAAFSRGETPINDESNEFVTGYDYKMAYGGAGDLPSLSSESGTKSAKDPTALDDRIPSSVEASRGSVSASKVSENIDGLSMFDEDSIDRVYGMEEIIEVIAPAGKLGVVIDTPIQGAPIVHALRETSVLADRIKIGDKLISLDGEDISGKSAIQVSKMISSKSTNPERYMTFLRPANHDT